MCSNAKRWQRRRSRRYNMSKNSERLSLLAVRRRHRRRSAQYFRNFSRELKQISFNTCALDGKHIENSGEDRKEAIEMHPVFLKMNK